MANPNAQRAVLGFPEVLWLQSSASTAAAVEAQRDIEFEAFCGTQPPTPDDVLAYRKQVLERYGEVVKRAGLPLNEGGTVDWQAVIEEERQKLNQQTES